MLLLMNSNSRWGEYHPSRVQPLTLAHVLRSGELADMFSYQLKEGQHLQYGPGRRALPQGPQRPLGPVPARACCFGSMPTTQKGQSGSPYNT